MKKLLLFLLFISLTVFGLFWFLFNTPTGFKWLVQTTLLREYKLSAFSIEKIATNPLREMMLQGVQISLPFGKIKIQSMGLEMSPEGSWQFPILWVENFNLESKDISVERGAFKLGLKPMQATPTGFGSIQADRIVFQKRYRLNEMRGIITNFNPIHINPLDGKVLNGVLNAEILLNRQSGQLTVKGKLIDGQMDSQLVRFLLEQSPMASDRERLLKLIRERQAVPFEQASFNFTNRSPYSFQGKLSVESKKLKLNLNLSLDVNFEDARIPEAITRLAKVFGREK